MSGVDSAIGPTVAQAQAVRDAGHLWWGWYTWGPGAWHNWREDELANLTPFDLSLPIMVPAIAPDGRIASGEPAKDALTAVWIAGHQGWKGTIALDTEASMRGAEYTPVYIRQWVGGVHSAGWEAVVYCGGLVSMADWPADEFGGAFPWWIIPGGRQAPAGQAWQVGQDTIAGLHVDLNSIGSGFPLATRS